MEIKTDEINNVSDDHPNINCDLNKSLKQTSHNENDNNLYFQNSQNIIEIELEQIVNTKQNEPKLNKNLLIHN